MVNEQPEGGGGREHVAPTVEFDASRPIPDTNASETRSPARPAIRELNHLEAKVADQPPTESSPSHAEQPVPLTLLSTISTSERFPQESISVPLGSTFQDTEKQNAHHAPLATGYASTSTVIQGTSAPDGDFLAQRAEVPALGGTDLPSVPLHPSQSSVTDIAFLESAASVDESECPRIQAFAKLEFDDGQFYMNTYSVELGRDIRAARVAFRNGFDPNQESTTRQHKRSNSSADANQPPQRLRNSGSRNMENSVVSETGGIIGVDVSDDERRKKSKKRRPKSTSSSSHNLSRKSSMHIPGPQTDYQSLAMASLTDPTSIDALNFLPSPEECPLIPIHPPAVAEGSTTGHRGISRRHVRIAYNFEKRLFELEVIGKNGAFMDEQYYPPGEVQELKSGSYIQIGGVGVRFVLPDVAIGETGAEGIHGSESVIGSAMSFDFEDGRGESITMADSEPTTSSDDDSLHGYGRAIMTHHRSVRTPVDQEVDDDDGEEDEEDEEDEGDQEDQEEEEEEQEEEQEEELEPRKKGPILRLTKPAKPSKGAKIKSKPKVEPKEEPPVQPPKRKGPGRPPKNGIISKREQALLARQAREAAKAEALQNGLIKPGKGSKTDDTRVIPQPDAKPEKRKYTKRKKPEDQTEEQAQTRETTHKTDSMPPEQALQAQPPKPVKEKRPPKPPRSPSPVFDEATLTAEQLAKPSQSYVVLIHEALTNSKTGAMSLPQIYRAIERRYPYYKLRVTTTGWQSSVRHNLSQHPAFRKIERDGKGWMWGLVPEISIEKEKKRRPSPPPMPPQQYYQQGPHMYRHPYPYPGIPPPNGYHPPPIGHTAYGMHSGMPPPPHGFPPSHAGLPRGPNGLSLPLAAQSNASSTYQSPYQPAPPPSQPAAPPQPPSQQQQSAPSNLDGSTSTQTASATTNQVPPPPPYHNPTNSPPNAPPHQSPKISPPAPSDQAKILEMVGLFKKSLVASLATLPHAEEVVTQAINRTLGIPPPPNVTAKEHPEEEVIMKTLAKMLGAVIPKEKAQRQASTPVQKSPKAVQKSPKTVAGGDWPDRVERPRERMTQTQLSSLMEGLEGEERSMKAEKGQSAGSSAPEANGIHEEESSARAVNGLDNGGRAKSLKRELEEDGTSTDAETATAKPQAKRVSSRVGA